MYLLPVVELVGGAENSYVLTARDMLDEIGMKPVVIAGEIDAHIGDRLLEAVWREALWLVKDGIATTMILTISLPMVLACAGPRWACLKPTAWPVVRQVCAISLPSSARLWPALTKLMDVPELTDELIDTIASQSDAQSGHLSIRQLERVRDRNLVGFLKVPKDHHRAAGAVLSGWDEARRIQLPPTLPEQQVPL